METRKQNGDEYPPKSLYYIVCGLLRHCRDMNVHDKNFLDQKDGRFAHFRRVLDAKMKDSLSKGLGTKVRRADPVSDDDEEKLWANGPRCIVDFYETYLKAIGSGVFYRKPLISDVQDKHRYGKSALGVNKLNGLMREMCEKGGLVGNFTNHSGKRTCATALYQAGIDEQQIMERTGHRSTKGVRTYKTANSNIQKRVSDVLNPPSDRDMNDSLQESVQTKTAVAEPFERNLNKKHCLGDITNTFYSVFAIFRDIPCEVLHKSLILVRILEKNKHYSLLSSKRSLQFPGKSCNKNNIGNRKKRGTNKKQLKKYTQKEVINNLFM
ncbi:unnamed protein product [Mytilus edulis]|uniref:Tyr recombinase domain-containing protein n=1 Tax=Mytilus edulis TaxID=6550 RepID=A0A8S3UKK7_MYTED|nr:unnamed protein product [Mytilus edulis]